jgi:hypothetical protein
LGHNVHMLGGSRRMAHRLHGLPTA